MKKSITEYRHINEGITEQAELTAVLGYTADDLRNTIQQPEYATEDYTPLKGKKEKAIEATVERVTGFGLHMSNAFESLSTTLGRVPTQREFNEYCLELAEAFWNKSNPEGISWDATVAKAVTNRNYRCYISQIVEMHCGLLIAELFPEWKVYNSDLLDILMGVDLVVETETKRIYLHVMKNSRYSFLSFRKKEKRGGMRFADGKFRKYHRDFTGDRTLMYEGRPESSSDTTEFVNGIPLFKPEWLTAQLMLFEQFEQFGEPLANSEKLQYMDSYLEKATAVIAV